MLDSPIVIPSGFNFGHAVYSMRIISLSPSGIPESAKGNGIYAYEEHKHDNVKNRDVVPVPSNVFEHTSLARVAVVAKQSWGVIPTVAIRVWGHYHCFLVVHARCWWLTTS